MTQTLLTRGEMERSLSQSVQAFYRHRLGCRIKKVSCHIIDNKLAIAIENSITPLEKLLLDNDSGFVKDLRDRIDDIVKQELICTIETILGVKIAALSVGTTLDNDLTGVVAILEQKPEMRNLKRFNSHGT